MKNSIKNLFAAALTTIILGATAVTVSAAEKGNSYTNLTSVKNISKIKISGNVKLILIQDAKESVEVYDNYYTKNALVQQQNGELRISSFNTEALTVIAHVNNITNIEASNSASVKTAGNFNLLNLNLVLNDKATADITANTLSLTTNVNGASALNLKGNTESYNAVLSSSAKVGMNDFTAIDSNVSAAPTVVYSANRFEDIKLELLETII
ncbi:GIN domain-containing protein [Pedobacter sp.]|uniref:GIN domain-containing protein n=1 Tax=Pedobacter sp. TaxID=1411316 RepID=UPI003BAD12E9